MYSVDLNFCLNAYTLATNKFTLLLSLVMNIRGVNNVKPLNL